MRMSYWRLPVIVAVAVIAAERVAYSQEGPRQEKGEIDAVTLFRGQALVQRRVPVNAPKGRLELVVTDLPEQVVADSLFAEGDGIEVRAVRFRTRAVGESPREKIRAIQDETQKLQDELAWVTKQKRLLAEREAFLAKLENFAAPTASMELSKGVLDATSLERIATFSFDQRKQAAEALQKLELEERKLQAALLLAQRRLAEISAGSSKTVREAVVFLEKRDAAAGVIRLSYLVSQASWIPTYNFRAKRGVEKIEVEYNALIRQMSGEDWSGVELTLSTASPALSSQGPGLAPFKVRLASAGQQGDGQQMAEAYRAFKGRLKQAEFQQRGAQRLADNQSFNWAMNSAANDFQGLELRAGQEQLDLLALQPVGADEGPSVTYHLESAVSLDSRSDLQMVPIVELSLPSRFYHVATPVLTSYVYREAELANDGIEALLAGEVSAYLDGRFVGRGEIPMVARGQAFVVGFGADGQLRARRELVEKTDTVQGGNREVSFDYRLVIENYKTEAVKLRLIDRIPVPERSADVRITLAEMKEKLSADKLYLRVERPNGILRWDIEVAAVSSGDVAWTLDYGYRLEFAKNQALGTSEGPGQADEFHRIQRARTRR